MDNKLTNADISSGYRDYKFWLMRSDLISEFAKWVVSQSPYDAPDITKALEAWAKFVGTHIEEDMPKSFTYDELARIVHEDVFEGIHQIYAFNVPKINSGPEYERQHMGDGEMRPDFDFIDLGALARNVFYGIRRESITEGTYEKVQKVA